MPKQADFEKNINIINGLQAIYAGKACARHRTL
jgi:hypothetical protein